MDVDPLTIILPSILVPLVFIVLFILILCCWQKRSKGPSAKSFKKYSVVDQSEMMRKSAFDILQDGDVCKSLTDVQSQTESDINMIILKHQEDELKELKKNAHSFSIPPNLSTQQGGMGIENVCDGKEISKPGNKTEYINDHDVIVEIRHDTNDIHNQKNDVSINKSQNTEVTRDLAEEPINDVTVDLTRNDEVTSEILVKVEPINDLMTNLTDSGNVTSDMSNDAGQIIEISTDHIMGITSSARADSVKSDLSTDENEVCDSILEAVSDDDVIDSN